MNDNIHETLKRDLPSASKEEMEWDVALVLNRLRDEADSAGNRPNRPIDERVAAFERSATSIRWRRLAAIPAAAAIVLAVFLAVTWRQDAFAVVEKGKLYRVADGKSLVKVPVDTPVSTDDGAVVKFPDGTRMEMGGKSEVVLEHGNQQTRIRVNTGSVNVTLSKEPSGTLVVQNREVTLPAQTKTPPEPRLAFEVASIRPSSGVTVPGGRGGPNPVGNGCVGLGTQIDLRFFIASNFSLFNLISKAYPEWAASYQGCMGVISANLLTGGEDWMKRELWDIRAMIPEGTPSYTGSQFWEGKAPEIQKMLQTLLADRFKLVLRKETKTMPVYFLTVAKGGPKFNGIHPSVNSTNTIFLQDGKNVGPAEAKGVYMAGIQKDANGKSFILVSGLNVTMGEVARNFILDANRVVLDRTGLTGEYTFYMETAVNSAGAAGFLPGISGNAAPRPTKMEAIQDLGLKLESGTAPIEVWTIEHAERPSEN
jgi:uncharacterized protein (TIGR03435 family)